MNDALRVGLSFLLIIPALVLHELAHGLVAFWLGDSTAKRAGRLTLNPLRHIDLFGTVLMPLLLFIGSGGKFGFGYAKPVPINPNNFRDRRKGILLTGIAGPAANVILALAFGPLCRVILLLAVPMGAGSIPALSVVVTLLYQFAYINLMFAFFNLIPIPPLDGSRVLQYVLPRTLRQGYAQLERYGFLIILGIMIFFRGVFTGYFNYTAVPIVRLLTGLNLF
ncbi:MAG: site-2 protease family protein [Actinomycetia bacterium]|nr:site-2 protease family protein [Actinomycetes bacterium]